MEQYKNWKKCREEKKIYVIIEKWKRKRERNVHKRVEEKNINVHKKLSKRMFFERHVIEKWKEKQNEMFIGERKLKECNYYWKMKRKNK